MSSPIVSKVSPTEIGLGGGAITIEGAGFSKDVFNQFDPVLGNKVLHSYSLDQNFLQFIPSYRSGLPMSMCLFPARIQSTGTSCLRILRIHLLRGLFVIFLLGKASKDLNGSSSSSKLMGKRLAIMGSLSDTVTDTLQRLRR